MKYEEEECLVCEEEECECENNNSSSIDFNSGVQEKINQDMLIAEEEERIQFKAEQQKEKQEEIKYLMKELLIRET